LAFAALAREVAAVSGPVFIHCAAGRRRSATLAAAVIIARGLARDVDAAEALMKLKRPVVRLGQQQRALLLKP
jgi:protein-tyrosine phosphatase